MAKITTPVTLACDAWHTLVEDQLRIRQDQIRRDAEDRDIIEWWEPTGCELDGFESFEEALKNPEQASGGCGTAVRSYKFIEGVRERIKTQYEKVCRDQGWAPKPFEWG